MYCFRGGGDPQRKLSTNDIGLIAKYQLDCAILSNPRTQSIKVLESANVKVIITGLKFRSLISSCCKTLPTQLLPQYRIMSRTKLFLKLARVINPALYDATIDSLDFSNAKIQTNPTHKSYINDFLSQHINNKSIKIFINPFSKSTSYQLNIDSWLSLIDRISKIPNIALITSTFPAIHNDFMKILSAHRNLTLAVFQNNDDLLNLTELISRMDLVISPSTGVIHIASNLQIPSIGLFSRYDSKKWATFDNNYVIIKKPKNLLNSNDEEYIIDEIMQKITIFLIKN